MDYGLYQDFRKLFVLNEKDSIIRSGYKDKC